MAIRERDLDGLAETVARDELTLITADGRLVRDPKEFLAMHREWFAGTTWSLDAEVASFLETAELGLVVLRLDYRDDPPGGPPIRESSWLSLAFALRDGRWVMVHDQNTPIK